MQLPEKSTVDPPSSGDWADLHSVSVVIPCYRCGSTISRAVQSVYEQKCRPFEVILVDDCSGDNTLKVLYELRDKYPLGWVKVIPLDRNNGAASARNRGWDVASGDFVALLDSDDAWHPDKIRLQLDYMRRHPEVEVSGHGYFLVNGGGEKVGAVDGFDATPISRWSMLLRNTLVTPSLMIKNNPGVRFLEGQRHMEDHLFLMKTICSGRGISISSQKLAFIYKPIYGSSGLSSQMWAMERAELGNYRILYRDGDLSLFGLAFLWVYSLLKYVRRLLIVKFLR